MAGWWKPALLAAMFVLVVGGGAVFADEKDGRLDIYFIDVEGGAATLLITPAGESLLIDSGYPDNNFRDRDRILKVLREETGRKQLDHALVTHWHLDHYGNHAALASQIKIHNFWDRGIPETLAEDAKFTERIGHYRAASQGKSKKLSAGDTLPLKSADTPLSAKIITASGEVIPNDGEPNLFASEFKAQADDPSDNAKSVSFLFKFGAFSFLDCGDLTWNTEAKLMTPNNPIGKVEVFMATHHGLNVSNNPVLVLAIDPRVVVFCNGPEKGGDLETLKTVRRVKSLQAIFQLHRNTRLKPEEQTAPEFIANTETTAECKGRHIKLSVAPGGKEYTVQIAGQEKLHTFKTRE